MVILYYPKCSTCNKALKFLDDLHLEYEKRDIIIDNPTKEEIMEYHQLSNKPLKSFFNVNGKKYRELKLKTKLPFMSDDEIYELLASDGMLVKRPLLVLDDDVLIGFKVNEWSQVLKSEE